MGTPRHGLRRLGGGLGEHDGELVAADPRHKIGGARDSGQPSRDLSQHPVAGLVTELIVHVLEPVDIQARERQWTAVSLSALDFGCQPDVKGAMVREPRQRIGIRLALKASRGALRLCKHDLEVTDPGLELMLAQALAVARRVFEVRRRHDTHYRVRLPIRAGSVSPRETSHGEADGDHAEAQTEENDQVDTGERQRPASGLTENVCAAAVLIRRRIRARREYRS
jgi:hypothetical protein